MMTSEPLENRIPKANAMEYYAVDSHGNELYWPYLLSTISEYQESWQLLDYSRLADAVAKHETGYCTSPNSPTANARNNCWGIMTWQRGIRELKTYKTIEEGKQDFIRIWSTHYKTFPTLRMAEIYSGKDQSVYWLNNVTKFYYEN